MTGRVPALCDECGQAPPTVRATMRPLDWDGVGREPREVMFYCAACLALQPSADVVRVAVLKKD